MGALVLAFATSVPSALGDPGLIALAKERAHCISNNERGVGLPA